MNKDLMGKVGFPSILSFHECASNCFYGLLFYWSFEALSRLAVVLVKNGLVDDGHNSDNLG